MKFKATLIGLGILLVGCSNAGGEDKTLAQVNDEVLTLEEFNQQLSELPPQYRSMLNAEGAYEEIVDQWINTRLLVEEAKQMGLDKREDIKKKLADIKNQILAEEVIKERILNEVKIDETEVEKYYADHKEDFNPQVEVRARHILIKVDKEADTSTITKAKEKAEEILGKVKTPGADFAELAGKYSEDPMAEKGGDLGFFSEGQMVKPFEQAAFALEEGEISDLVRTQFGFHIIKLEERRGASHIELEEIKEKVKKVATQAKQKETFDQLLEKLKQKTKVVRNIHILKTPEPTETEESKEEKKRRE
ncbi:MAG: peptidylprolyl isomerase [bacterium]|nr:peptidylprolyl isomerase [bacterium]